MFRRPPSAVLELALAACAFLVQPAFAVPFTFSGELSSIDGFFNRPKSMTALSALGTHNAYDVFSFRVSKAGTYEIQTTAFDVLNRDSYLALYQGSFRTAAPLSNLLQVNDDGGFGSLSLITWALQANTDYLLVFTSFMPNTFGAYAGQITSIDGGGQALIPEAAEVKEPGTLVLLPLAALGLALARRWRPDGNARYAG
jgi:hypothetical protein